MARETFLQSL